MAIAQSMYVARAGADCRSLPKRRGERVAIYSRRAQNAAGARDLLQSTCESSTHAEWHDFLDALTRAHAALVFCARLGHDLPLPALSDIGVRWPLTPWLLVTDGASDNLRLLVHIRPTEVLCWGTDDHRIAAAIREMLQHRPFDRLADKFRHMYELPSQLRSAIAFVMAQASGTADDDALLPVRSIRELATRLQQSEDTLAAAARRHGLSLRRIIEWTLALWAIQLRTRGAKWEAIAWRLDYSSMSGLSDLFLRTVGIRPSALPDRVLSDWFDEFERACVPNSIRNGISEAMSDSANAQSGVQDTLGVRAAHHAPRATLF